VALDPVDRWWLTQSDAAVVEHLKRCPFNVKSPSKKLEKTRECDAMLTHLKASFAFKKRRCD